MNYFARYWAILPEACANLRGLHVPHADSTAGLTPGQLNPLPNFYPSSENLAGDALPAFTAPAPQATPQATPQAAPQAACQANDLGKIAIIAIDGIITRQSQAEILVKLQAALDNPDTKGIMLSINSPGGIVAGTKELADFISLASQKKPCASYADGLCASAAFWLAAATGKIYTPKTASLGSIGILAVHTDWSKFNENMGLNYTYLTGGKFKAVGNANNPLSDEDLNIMQHQITELHSIFKADIQKHLALSKAPELWGEGQVFLGAEAKELGLASAIVQDLYQAISTFHEENFMDKQEFLAKYPDLAAEIRADFKAELGAELKAELLAEQASYGSTAPATPAGASPSTASAELSNLKSTASREILGFVEVLLGTEAKEKITVALQTGATAEQFRAIMSLLPAGQGAFKGMGSPDFGVASNFNSVNTTGFGSATGSSPQDSYAQKMLATIQAAHATALAVPLAQNATSNPLLADAEKRALAAKKS